MHRLAIDLGTSNTVAVLRGVDGQVRPVLFDGREQLPSAVHAGAGGALVAGLDAERLARADPAAFEPNPKRRIDDGTVLLGAHTVDVATALAAVLRTVADHAGLPPAGDRFPAGDTSPANAVRPEAGAGPSAAGAAAPAAGAGAPAAGGGVAGEGGSAAGAVVAGRTADSVVLTVPAGWGAPRRAVLADAAARAGLGAVELVSEPVAAAAYFTARHRDAVPPGSALLVVDLGAGTADLAVVRDGQVVAQGGLDVGGLDVDAALIGILGDLVGTTAPDVWHRLAAPVTAADRRDRLLLWQEVRAAKESLSRLSVAPVHVPGCPSDPHLTREELEAVAAPLLAPVADLAAALTAGLAIGPLAGPLDALGAGPFDGTATARPEASATAPPEASATGPLGASATGPFDGLGTGPLNGVGTGPLDSRGAGLSLGGLTAAPHAGPAIGVPHAGPAAGDAHAGPATGLPGAGSGESAAAVAGGLAAVFLVGGGSRLPLLARLLHARLGVAPTTVERPETVVAEGALHAAAATAAAATAAAAAAATAAAVATMGAAGTAAAGAAGTAAVGAAGAAGTAAVGAAGGEVAGAAGAAGTAAVGPVGAAGGEVAGGSAGPASGAKAHPRTPLRRRWRSPATALLVLLCFALPFATVSCGLPSGYGRAQPGGTSQYTGFDLATGGAPDVRPADQVRPPEQRRPDRLGPQPAQLAALVLLAAVLAAAGIGSDRRRRVATAALAGLAAVALVTGQVLVAERLAAAVVAQSRLPDGKTAGDMVGTGAGFWVAVVLLALLALGNLAALASASGRPAWLARLARAAG